MNFSKPCKNSCIKDVCVCRDHLYRNECNECVTEDECGMKCKPSQPIQCNDENEILYSCFDPSLARVCPNVKCSKPRDLFFQSWENKNVAKKCIVNVCDCANSYYRNKCGDCVSLRYCDEQCFGIQCNGENEILKRNYRECEARTCSNLKNPIPCKGKAGKYRCSACDCAENYARNNYGRCIPVDQCEYNLPCVCSNPCASDPNKDWICLNDCNWRTCDNYYSSKMCSGEDCNYACHCSVVKDLWWNGTNCVKSSLCPTLNRNSNEFLA